MVLPSSLLIYKRWHNRIITEIESRLQFLKNRIEIELSIASQPGPDIRIITKKENKIINIEVQQFDSGGSWRTTTISSWRARHDLFTLVVFPESVLERVLSNIGEDQAYNFFTQDDVFLFSDTRISELVSFIGAVIVTKDI